MTKETLFTLALAFSLGAALGSGKSAIPPTQLSGAGLAEFPGKEARRYTAQIAPGAMTPWRRHPGHFFTHVAEGTGLVQEDGKPEIQLEPGATL